MARAGPQTNAGVRSMMMSNLETLLVSPALAPSAPRPTLRDPTLFLALTLALLSTPLSPLTLVYTFALYLGLPASPLTHPRPYPTFTL